MSMTSHSVASYWKNLAPRFLPFADAASHSLPISRLLRLSLFQVSVGMAIVLLNGTLNRVMIVELGMSTTLVAIMVGLPLAFAPLRALIGYRSDNHRSALGWRRVPFIWFGTLLQFGGLAIMPFALLVMSGDTHGPVWYGHAAAALAFLLVGAGLHTTQTAGLALATDLAPKDTRPRVVAFLYVTLLVGMMISAFAFGALLQNFTQIKLIQIIQGAAVVTFVLNVIALWKQEPRERRQENTLETPNFAAAWRTFSKSKRANRSLVALGFGTAAFAMQDILLEPYGGEILNLSVSATTALTGLFAIGALVGLFYAAHRLGHGHDPYRLAATGIVIGIAAFSAVIFAAPLDSVLLFQIGTALIGVGGGLFAVGTLTAAMNDAAADQTGLALGAWGAVQATAAGLAIALGGAIRDIFSTLAVSGTLGPALQGKVVGYSVVYHIEIVLLFVTLAIVGPLVGTSAKRSRLVPGRFGLAAFPG